MLRNELLRSVNFLPTYRYIIPLAYNILSGKYIPENANHAWTKSKLNDEKVINFQRFPRQATSHQNRASTDIKFELEFYLYYLKNIPHRQLPQEIKDCMIALVNDLSSKLHEGQGTLAATADAFLVTTQRFVADPTSASLFSWQIKNPFLGKIYYLVRIRTKPARRHLKIFKIRLISALFRFWEAISKLGKDREATAGNVCI